MRSLGRDQLLIGSLMMVAGLLNTSCGNTSDPNTPSGTKTLSSKVSEVLGDAVNDFVNGGDGGNGGDGSSLSTDIVKLIKDNISAVTANLLKMFGGGQGDKEVPKEKSEELKNQIKDLLKQIAANKDQLNALIEGKIDALKKVFEEQINGLNSKVDNLAKEVSDLKNRQDNLENKQNENDKKLKEQENRIKSLEKMFGELTDKQKEILAQSGLLTKGNVTERDLQKTLDDVGKAEWKSYSEFCKNEHPKIIKKVDKDCGLSDDPVGAKETADGNANAASKYSVEYDSRYEQQLRTGLELLFTLSDYEDCKKTGMKHNISEEKAKECEAFQEEWNKLAKVLKGQGFGIHSHFIASVMLLNKKSGVVVFKWKDVNNDKGVSLGNSIVDSCKNKFSKQLNSIEKIDKKMQEGCKPNKDLDDIFADEGFWENGDYNYESYLSEDGGSSESTSEGGSSSLFNDKGSGKRSVVNDKGSSKMNTKEGSSKISDEKKGQNLVKEEQKNSDPLARDIEEFCDFKYSIPHHYCMFSIGFSEEAKKAGKEKENNTKLKEGMEALKSKGWSDEKIKEFISVDFDKGTRIGSTVAELFKLIYEVSRGIDNVKSKQKDLDDVKEGDILYKSRKEWLDKSKKSLDEAIAKFKTGYTSITANNKKYTNYILNCYLIDNKDEVKSKLGL